MDFDFRTLTTEGIVHWRRSQGVLVFVKQKNLARSTHETGESTLNASHRSLRKSTILALLAFVFLQGCASAAKVENMAFDGPSNTYAETLRSNVVVVSASGGKKTNPLWTSEISGADFRAAVEQSLINEGLLSESGDYQLDISLIKVEQPLFGLNLDVTTEVRYIIKRSADASIVLDETVSATHTAGVADAFAAVKRLRLANEGSAKANIAQFLKKLSEFDNSVKLSML